ncbi:MAG: hypothetical protein CMG67_02940 [Candidatus Marinimicrobia bacterium]|nr:hypothetical protein [Candidatus Neomarinimicrobiota bacterium]
MKKNYIVIYLTIINIMIAQYERPGSTSAQFLKIDVSPAAAAMAGSYISVANGADALYYNPAAIANMSEKVNLSFNKTNWFAGIVHDYSAIAFNAGRLGSFGALLTRLVTDEMKVRTPMQPDGTGETFYAGSYRLGAAYARKMTDRVNFGGTFNYIFISLFREFKQEAVTLELSASYDVGIRDMRFAMKIGNFGSSVKFVNEIYEMPTNFSFGLSGNIYDKGPNKFLLSASILKPNDGPPIGLTGFEYSMNQIIFFRGGYNFGHSTATWSMGGGVRFKLAERHFSTDFSINDFSALGITSRYGINLHF